MITKKILPFSTLILTLACGKEIPKEDSFASDPSRCTVSDVGEAANYFPVQENIPDNRMVTTQGLAHPHALVWRDSQTNQTYYVTRVMGTEQKLFFLKQIKGKERPGIASKFSGQLLRWDHLPDTLSLPIARAFAEQYNIKIDKSKTYIILADKRPDGCAKP